MWKRFTSAVGLLEPRQYSLLLGAGYGEEGRVLQVSPEAKMYLVTSARYSTQVVLVPVALRGRQQEGVCF